MNNVSIRLIFDRKNVATKKNQASVQIEVSYQRKRKYIGTGVRLYADQWGKDSKIKNHPQAIQLNKQITDQVSEIFLFRELSFDTYAFIYVRCKNRNYCIFLRISCKAFPNRTP